MEIRRQLVLRQRDDVGQAVIVLELCWGRAREQTDGDAFGTVHDDVVERPGEGTGEAVLLERGVLWGRGGWGAEDGLGVSMRRR